MLVATWIVVGFLAGSIPFGMLIARARGIDIQTVGSGNIGATNVARTLGKSWGVVVLLLDASKGAIPVLLSSDRGPGYLPMAVGLAAVLGHCFCPWLRFRGGKGVATALGVFLVIDPVASAIAIAVFVAVYLAFRAASLGSMVAALAFPGLLWWRGHGGLAVALAATLAVVIIFRHRENIDRLRKGTEHGV